MVCPDKSVCVVATYCYRYITSAYVHTIIVGATDQSVQGNCVHIQSTVKITDSKYIILNLS